MDLKPGCHIHLMGICGTAMASMAGLLKDRGFKITGSDMNPYPPMSTQLESLGITIQKGYKAENLHPQPDFVIVGNVISKSNEEAQELMKLGIPYTSLPKAMGELIIADRESVVISGTHGKTTTTSMMSWVAENAGVKPGFLIGGIPKNFSQSFKNPEGNYFIIEGDEYDTAFFDKVPKFIHYKPKHVILTSVEFDHADIYKDLQAVKDSFARLMTLIPENGTLLACAEDANVLELRKLAKCKNSFTYGFKAEADFRAKVLFQNEKGVGFEVHHKGEILGPYSMQITGDYNILNATAVIAMSKILGFSENRIQIAMESFEGVKRRQEILGEPNGILVIEDFAHHPTAVRETVKGIQKKYPSRKVFSVFEPRSATSRRKVFQKDYVEAFKGSHEVLLAKAFDQSKIDSEDRFSSEELVADLQKSGVTAGAFDSADHIVEALKSRAKTGDVILIMSNGGFDGIYTKLMKALE
ncbi:UDP-N-acetylmuramate:L-alanyl-gamma-D-glutamyl-meso-diaminopimelate ligase [Bdellovibrio svalbardensis]|uniref:UDP-N-acetylmuramate:L-alanyl-gamma-D-glutamyl-meso-diaminopimelate ligase n=1 Tax=Bdellovibrio svalbardensis TaxID=2972972 RepID=A0ABT6DII3_9BACT|nr:UDP-N-acetylmuramate:L-alanyl-gamma-D-glutamyl-meso-diaminopimelate ligase [Bdellovibrio svalbardensis]MDG0816655.1 UDP-N-acetylmuramate:L-alanyl-gamma-D-glutamyl-meso-diaminopimelate ligase [Bdellovibrio svalbardensis]